MSKRGKTCYVPRSVIEEVEKLKRERRLKRDSEAFKEYNRYAKIGKELERQFSLGIPRKWRKKG